MTLMNRILFTDFEIVSGLINLKFKENYGEYQNLYFQLKPAIIPNNNLIALALSTLCGTKYGEIHFDLDISSDTLREISNYTGSEVISTEKLNKKNTSKSKLSFLNLFGKLNNKKTDNNGIVLNFSGGFDSLAAKALMPENTKLVSMDFGGKFSREKKFFRNFDTCIVSTNLVETPLRYNSWSFMGISSILFSEYLNVKYYTFGGILEAGIANLYTNPPAAKNISFPAFSSAGMTNAPYTIGITEVGTIKILAHFYPELISKSLDSLANPGEEKRYRKQVLAKILENKTRSNFNLNILDKPSKVHFKFGENFAADFLSFYIIKYLGLEIASHTVSDIPSEVVILAEQLSLDFYEKVNPLFLEKFPEFLINDFLKKLNEAGIQKYNNTDWEEYGKVRNVLAKYYDIK